MQKLTSAIQEAAKKLLEDKKVDLVVGFAKGSLPLRNTPCFVRRPEDVTKLEWGAGCENNLANYLRKREGRVAVVAKGCDVRSIIELIKENQIRREDLVIIGVPCSGMISRQKVEKLLGGEELTEAGIDGGTVSLKGKSVSKSVPLAELLHDSCRDCTHGNPVIHDILAGDAVPAKDDDRFQEVADFEAIPAEKRRAELAREFSKCIRCYACRQACPMCYCEECFVDCSTPIWINKANDPIDNLMFQAVRVLHSAGRCSDCGACERACPMDLKLRRLTRKMIKDVKDLFGYEAGANLDDVPALANFAADDPQPFLVKE